MNQAFLVSIFLTLLCAPLPAICDDFASSQIFNIADDVIEYPDPVSSDPMASESIISEFRGNRSPAIVDYTPPSQPEDEADSAQR